MKINTNLASMPAGYLFSEIAKRVNTYTSAHPEKKILRLGIGDVTLPLAPAAVEAMAAAAREMGTQEGFHGYAPDFGYDFLLDAIRSYDYLSRGIALERDEIFISDGAKTDTSGLQELFALDIKVAVTDPVYPVYVDSNAMAGRIGTFDNGRWSGLVYLPCTAENEFVPPLPESHVDLIYLCYPNNPTGTVLSKVQLKRFVDYARENDSIILYDAAYKAFISDSSIPRSIYEVEGARDVAIECCSFSKTAGFTGVRCAYTIIPNDVTGRDDDGSRIQLNKLWRRRTAARQNGVSYPVQRAAEAVLYGSGQIQSKAAVTQYLANAKTIRDGLNRAGFTVFGGIHAPYIWLKIPGGMDSWSFFDLLLHKVQVVGTPGAGFGPCGEGYFRLTAFNTAENTAEAILRLQNIL
jgi:LL-diaminopimelate aminotransferase